MVYTQTLLLRHHYQFVTAVINHLAFFVVIQGSLPELHNDVCQYLLGFLSVSLFISIYVSIHVYLYFSIFLALGIFMYLFIQLSIYLSLSLSLNSFFIYVALSVVSCGLSYMIFCPEYAAHTHQG